MDLFSAVSHRRSVRAFTQRPVTQEELDCLLDAARRAPSAGNGQPWEFVVVRRREIIEQLCPACCTFSWIAKAPVVIAVCIDLQRSQKKYGGRGISLFGIQDTAAAAQNIALGAEALGLSSCWVGLFDEAACARLLGLRDGLRPVVLLPIGESAAPPAPERRLRPLEDIVRYLD